MIDILKNVVLSGLKDNKARNKARAKSDLAILASVAADTIDTPEAHLAAAALHGKAAKAYEKLAGGQQ